MRPGFFLDIAHNVGNGFSYELLAVKNYCDIPKYGPVHTVIHSVVRKCNIADTETPTICEKDGSWVVTNRDGDPIGEDCSTSSEELKYNVQVSDEGARFFDKREKLFRPVCHAYDHLIHDSSLRGCPTSDLYPIQEESLYQEEDDSVNVETLYEYNSGDFHGPSEDIVCPTVVDMEPLSVHVTVGQTAI